MSDMQLTYLKLGYHNKSKRELKIRGWRNEHSVPIILWQAERLRGQAAAGLMWGHRGPAVGVECGCGRPRRLGDSL